MILQKTQTNTHTEQDLYYPSFTHMLIDDLNPVYIIKLIKLTWLKMITIVIINGFDKLVVAYQISDLCLVWKNTTTDSIVTSRACMASPLLTCNYKFVLVCRCADVAKLGPPSHLACGRPAKPPPAWQSCSLSSLTGHHSTDRLTIGV